MLQSLQSSGFAIAASAILMLICYILPFVLYYLLYRFGDSPTKLLLIGAATFFVGGYVLELVLQNIVYAIFPSTAAGLLYSLLFSPLLFTAANFVAIKFFCKNMLTTGDSLMYSTGYVGLLNILMVGVSEFINFVNLISANGSSYLVVSDSDYESASDLVSASNLISESTYEYLQTVCARSASYIYAMCMDRLVIIAAYAAIIMLTWLAVSKKGALPLLGAVFAMRVIIAVPSVLNNYGVITNIWVAIVIAVIITALIWAATIFLRGRFIDNESIAKTADDNDDNDDNDGDNADNDL